MLPRFRHFLNEIPSTQHPTDFGITYWTGKWVRGGSGLVKTHQKNGNMEILIHTQQEGDGI